MPDFAWDAKLIAFNIVPDALHKDLVLTLTKLYDTGRDDLSFPRVLPMEQISRTCWGASVKIHSLFLQ
jgi:hypothetical protein